MKQMTDKNKVIFPNIHTRGGSRWISRISSQRIWSDMGTGCHGGAGVPIPGGVSETCGYATEDTSWRWDLASQADG